MIADLLKNTKRWNKILINQLQGKIQKQKKKKQHDFIMIYNMEASRIESMVTSCPKIMWNWIVQQAITTVDNLKYKDSTGWWQLLLSFSINYLWNVANV